MHAERSEKNAKNAKEIKIMSLKINTLTTDGFTLTVRCFFREVGVARPRTVPNKIYFSQNDGIPFKW